MRRKDMKVIFKIINGFIKPGVWSAYAQTKLDTRLSKGKVCASIEVLNWFN